jgi:hypothetical protein
MGNPLNAMNALSSSDSDGDDASIRTMAPCASAANKRQLNISGVGTQWGTFELRHARALFQPVVTIGTSEELLEEVVPFAKDRSAKGCGVELDRGGG